MYQHVVYSEFLPSLLGRKLAYAYGLLPEPEGGAFFKGYDPRVDPRITNEFGGGAWRFGHSLVPPTIQ